MTWRHVGAFLLACYLAVKIGTGLAGPMPEIRHDPPTPEVNYTLETLRILNQPRRVEVRDTPGKCNGGMMIASTVIFNTRTGCLE